MKYLKVSIISKVLLILSLFIVSCSNIKEYSEATSNRDRVQYIERCRVDTVVKRDSINTFKYGDTLIVEKYKYIYKSKIVKDTINIHDTITIVRNVDRVKEVNSLRLWQQVLIILGGIFSIILFMKFTGRL